MIMWIITIAIIVVGGGAFAYYLAKSNGWLDHTGPTQPLAGPISLAPANWVIGPIINGVSSSPGMPTNPNPSGATWSFNFPQKDGVHYVTTQTSGSLVGKTLHLKFTIAGTETAFTALNAGQPDTAAPAQVHLYFQQAGDNWDTDGYRWWSNPKGVMLANGTFTLDVPVTPDQWTGIFGEKGTDKPALWNAAVANVMNVGFTFGGEFFGHGVFANGPAVFTLNEFSVQ
jgi:hypothetical protein